MKITTEDIQVGFHARQILKGISIESKDTSTPIGISEFFRITRHATSHQIRNDAPSSALNGSNLLWSVPNRILIT